MLGVESMTRVSNIHALFSHTKALKQMTGHAVWALRNPS